jgi:hypothetical protein
VFGNGQIWVVKGVSGGALDVGFVFGNEQIWVAKGVSGGAFRCVPVVRCNVKVPGCFRIEVATFGTRVCLCLSLCLCVCFLCLCVYRPTSVELSRRSRLVKSCALANRQALDPKP